MDLEEENTKVFLYYYLGCVILLLLIFHDFCDNDSSIT